MFWGPEIRTSRKIGSERLSDILSWKFQQISKTVQVIWLEFAVLRFADNSDLLRNLCRRSYTGRWAPCKSLHLLLFFSFVCACAERCSGACSSICRVCQVHALWPFLRWVPLHEDGGRLVPSLDGQFAIGTAIKSFMMWQTKLMIRANIFDVCIPLHIWSR